MKAVIAGIVLWWGAVMLEQARPDLLPVGAVLVPMVIIGMFWNGTPTGVFVGGVLLVMDWIIRPQGWPLLPLAVTFGAVLLLTARGRRDVWTGRRRRWKIPDGMSPALLVVVSVVLLVGPSVVARQMSPLAGVELLGKYMLISLPLSLLLTGLMKVAGEFGWRRLV